MKTRLPCRQTVAMLVLATLLAAQAIGAGLSANWPQFRGPDGLGVADHPGLPDRWGANENVAWKAEVPGRGWSSPIVWGERVFVTTAVSEGEVEPAKKGLYLGGERKEIPKAEHRWLVLCFDLNSGRELWRQEAHRGLPPNPLHVKNTYASSTPVTDGERVYACFGNAGLYCYDMAGRRLWSTNWPPVKTRNGWGPAASPVLCDGRLFLVSDNDEESFATALDAKTGCQLWRVQRDEKSNWATPSVWRNDQRTELITSGTRRVRSYNLDGKLLWELGGMSSIDIPTPVSDSNLLYVSSGFVGDKVRPVFAVKPGASGDITLKPGQTNGQFIAWYRPTAGPYNPSPLLYGDYFYVLFDFGFLDCHDARTGPPGLPEAAHPGGRHLLHRLTLGGQWQNLRAERRRRHLRLPGRPRIQAAAHKLPRQDVLGYPGDCRPLPGHSHADPAVLPSGALKRERRSLYETAPNQSIHAR